MFIKAKEIARGLRLEGAARRGKDAVLTSRTWGDLQEALDVGSRGEPGGIRPEDFSIRDLAANTIFSRNGEPIGHAFIEEAFDPHNQRMQESMAAVDSTAFVGITGQLLINRLLDSYNAEEFVFSKMIPTQPTRLNGERIPGVSLPKDPGEDFTVAEEMDELHYVGFSEEYVETPATTKRQLGIGVTKEAIFFDRTGLVLQRAGYVGEILGLRKEKNLIATVIGANMSYKEKRQGDSSAYALATYYSQTDNGRWINHVDNNPLSDWTNIDVAEQTFDQVTDPNTGEPIVLPNRRVIFVPQIKRLSLNQLLQAQEAWRWTQLGSAPTAGNTGWTTRGKNPLMDLDIEMRTSRQLYKQLQNLLGLSAADASGYWFYGDPSAFCYMENWPITVVQAPNNSEAEFNQDIVVRFKASERGIPAIIEPRKFQRHRGGTTNNSASSSSGSTLPVIV